MTTTKGFSLVEAMVALALGGVVVASSVALYATAMKKAQDPARTFVAFSIAEQAMERLVSAPASSSLLDDQTPGDVYDPSPTGGVDGPPPAEQRVNEIGDPDPNGAYRLYWKLANPFGSVKSVVVYTEYTAPTGVKVVQLESYR